jgi:hypothetical protein
MLPGQCVGMPVGMLGGRSLFYPLAIPILKYLALNYLNISPKDQVGCHVY